MGTPAGEDDVDYDALKVGLEQHAEEVLGARYQISYRGVTYAPEQRCWSTCSTPAGSRSRRRKAPQWRRRLEPHRMVLAREDGKLLIVSGM